MTKRVALQVSVATALFVSPTTLPADTVDVFPLGNGHGWTYNYQYSYSCFNNFFEGSSTADSGSLMYRVIDSMATHDTTTWTIRVYRDFRRHYFSYIPSMDTMYMVRDSLSFFLWEETSLGHRMSVSNFGNNSLWVFRALFGDSQSIHRFQRPDSSGQFIVTTHLSTPLTNFQFFFKPDSGLVRMVQTSFPPCGHSGQSTRGALFARTLTSADEHSQISSLPLATRLWQNFPNPFNATTIIWYQLFSHSHVSLKVYNILGEEVRDLVDSDESAGTKQVEFNATNLPNGVYYYRLRTADFVATKKLVMLK